MTWNFDISAAPRGNSREVVRVVGKKTALVEVFTPTKIIAAGNGGVVTATWWMPDQERWCMFTKDVPPMAWQPWPTHPEVQP